MYLVIIVSKWKRKEHDQLDLVLMTNFSQSSFMWTITNLLSVFALIQHCLGWSSNIIAMNSIASTKLKHSFYFFIDYEKQLRTSLTTSLLQQFEFL